MPPKTRVFRIDPDDPDPAVLAEAAAVLRGGGLVAFPTETVYGLGADATNPEAVSRIFEAKGRPSTNPLIVHAAGLEDARRCVGEWPGRAQALADRFWPGPLSLVLPRSAIIPDLVTAGHDTVGVRVPRPRAARLLIELAGRPVAAPSANRSTGISPTQAGHVLKDLDGRIDLILDAGPTLVGLESTVLDLSGKVPRVLRPGQVTREDLAAALGEPVEESGAASPRSPGQMSIHYAPRVPTYRADPAAFRPDAVPGTFTLIAIGPAAPPGSGPNPTIHLPDPGSAAAWFYSCLHDLEAPPLPALAEDFILILPPPDEPRWRAIRDRIWRASTPWPPQIEDGPSPEG